MGEFFQQCETTAYKEHSSLSWRIFTIAKMTRTTTMGKVGGSVYQCYETNKNKKKHLRFIKQGVYCSRINNKRKENRKVLNK